MKIFIRYLDCCIDCPNMDETGFCKITYDVWQGIPTLRRIPDPNTIPEFCPLQDVEPEQAGVKNIG